jgi:hypothetical protein
MGGRLTKEIVKGLWQSGFRRRTPLKWFKWLKPRQ